MKALRIIIAALLVFSLFGMLLGCASKRSKPLASKVVTTTGTIFEGSGDAKEPAKMESKKAESKMIVPQGSIVEVTNEEGKPSVMKVSLSSPTGLVVTSSVDTFESAVSFSPPSPQDEAKAQGLKWFFIAGIAFAVVAVTFAYMGHGKAATIAGIGAVSVPLLGRFVASEKALWLCIGLGAVSLSLFCAWYLIKRKYPSIS